MTYELTATLSHESFDDPVIKKLYYTGDTFEDILNQIETLPQHTFNLKHYKATAFKDARDVKHAWKLREIKAEIPEEIA